MNLHLSYRDLNAFVVLIASALLAAALVLEYVWELIPCLLCMVQRFWVVMVGLFAAIPLLLNAALWHRKIWALAAMTSAVAGATFAVRQLWLQSLPIDEVPGCSPGVDYVLQVLPFGDALWLMMRGAGECAEILWQFLGISIPGWSLIGFICLFALMGAHFTRYFEGR